jgi:hypothetical protein
MNDRNISRNRSAAAVLDDFRALAKGPDNPANNPEYAGYLGAARERASFDGYLADRGPVAEEFGLSTGKLDWRVVNSSAEMQAMLNAAGPEGLSFTVGGRLADFGSSLDWWNYNLRGVPSLRPLDMTCSTVVASDPTKCGVTMTVRSMEMAVRG